MIRPATASDAVRLAEFAARTFADTFAAANRPEDIAEYLAKTYGEAQQGREIADPRVITLLGEHDGGLVAFAQVKIEEENRIEIARFYVDRERHGRGVAQELMQAVIDEAGRIRAKKLWLGVWERNDRAIAFYAKCGFRGEGSQPFLLGSDLQTDRVMVLDLEGVER